ncbi:MAG: AAA family ATPase [Candidatus Omnitrophica bacterium]|nr:AAA family ATPase [Candidatus Omnitrophota bacterium]HOX53963.1 AAA family ATPase [Candidatus Omnitrophota bacterium]
MYLKKLDMVGFKSFADKTTLHFEPGITAVVGPNGCGKSNIFDAIRWTLGEQSIKSLRGSKMEDVIFNGTDTKTALGFAEASLTFSNKEKFLPIEEDEVVITRRLFRSGESEYLINKSAVRLKDINELFMGTGITAESYSMVEQGKIDLIISSKPEDRRLIFDEAAGITKYKAKKKEAMNKLEDTENNLLRLNDIITEVKRQIGSIERQAKKAQQYKEESEKLRDLEIKMAKFQIGQVEKEKEELDAKIEYSKDQQSHIANKIDEATKILEDTKAGFKDSQEKINKLNENTLNLNNNISRNNELIELNRERIQEEGQRKNRLNQQKEYLNRIIAQEKEKIAKIEREILALKDIEQNNTSQIKQKKEYLHKLAEIIKEAQEAIARAKMDILELSHMQATLKNELNEVTSQLHGLLARKKRLDLEREKVTGEKQIVDDKLNSLSEQYNGVYLKLQHIKSRREEAETEREALKKEIEQTKNDIVKLSNEKLALSSQREFIEKLRLKYEDMPSAGKSIVLSEHKPSDSTGAFLGKIKGICELDDKTKNIIKEHFKDSEMADFYRIQCETKFISLDLQQIDDKINELAHQIKVKEEHEKVITSDVQNKEAFVEELEEEFRKEEIILSRVQTQKDSVTSEVNKLQEELDLVASELNETSSDLQQVKAKEENLAQQTTKIEDDRRSLESSIEASQHLIANKTKERESVSVEIAQLETELASLSDKERTQNDTLKMMNEAFRKSEEDLSSVEQEKQSSTKKSEELNNQIISLEKEIQTAVTQKEDIEKELLEIKKGSKDLIATIENQENDLKKFSQDLEKERQQFHDFLMKEQETSFKRNSIKERLMQAHKVNMDEVDVELPHDGNLDEINRQINESKARLDRFGTVNLVAIEEYEELKQRFEFLTKQQNDLLASKEDLSETINKINRTARNLFTETFESVTKEFKNYFRMLFGGGDAQLILIDPHNVLESGIEIIARPPGKKLQSISLLSGGEKALTAVALIFGVFKIKPSPFCILDEIDAPMDESNVGRFSQLLRDFTKTSQFIVVTHNKKTIVNADIMYGITMQETGVSRIVSVKFAKDKEEQIEQVPVAA